MVQRLCNLVDEKPWFLLIVVIIAPAPIWVPLVINTIARRWNRRKEEIGMFRKIFVRTLDRAICNICSEMVKIEESNPGNEFVASLIEGMEMGVDRMVETRGMLLRKEIGVIGAWRRIQNYAIA